MESRSDESGLKEVWLRSGKICGLSGECDLEELASSQDTFQHRDADVESRGCWGGHNRRKEGSLACALADSCERQARRMGRSCSVPSCRALRSRTDDGHPRTEE